MPCSFKDMHTFFTINIIISRGTIINVIEIIIKTNQSLNVTGFPSTVPKLKQIPNNISNITEGIGKKKYNHLFRFSIVLRGVCTGILYKMPSCFTRLFFMEKALLLSSFERKAFFL